MVRARRVLSVYTSKCRAGVINTFASVCVEVDHINPDTGKPYTMQTTAIFSDFAKRYNTTIAKTVTEKAVRAAHDVALQSIEAVIQEARGFYTIKDAKIAA